MPYINLVDFYYVTDFVHIQEFADELKIPFFETSAKSGANVEQVIKTIAEEIKKKL